ncbi:MAG: hypothetical protein WCL71_05925, partial [Deltaproteobacteria bacterium]
TPLLNNNGDMVIPDAQVLEGPTNGPQWVTHTLLWRKSENTLSIVQLPPGISLYNSVLSQFNNNRVITAIGPITTTDDAGNQTTKEKRAMFLTPIAVRSFDTQIVDDPESGKYRMFIDDPSDVIGLGHRTKIVSELKIAQWDRVFELSGTGVRWGKDTLDNDLDAFFVIIPNLPSPAVGSKHKVKLWTEVDTGAEVELDPVPGKPGTYRTKSLCLVADDEDDQEKIDGVADGALNDRTFKVALDGHLKVKLLGFGGSATAPEIELPVPTKKTVKVAGYVMQKGLLFLADAVPVATANSEIDFARARFATCGVKIVGAASSVKPNPAGVTFGGIGGQFDEPEYDSSTGKITLPAESVALFAGTTVPPDTIPCYYVTNFSTFLGGVTTVEKAISTKAYANRAVIDGDQKTISTLSHELLHVLINGVHGPPYNDYMSYFNSVKWMLWYKQDIGGVIGRKRIPDEMRFKILSSPLAK